MERALLPQTTTGSLEQGSDFSHALTSAIFKFRRTAGSSGNGGGLIGSEGVVLEVAVVVVFTEFEVVVGAEELGCAGFATLKTI